ncbi:hypothetical protein Bbelb_313590 [Branchiostoma belcheri]|nr:hypothetical protein Bbelb_313590 [Branchiostoma belcheri]
MANATTTLSTVAEELRELDLIFRSGSDLDFVERGYGRKLIHGLSTQNNILECEALKSLGDLYLQKAKMNDNKVENFYKACSLYTELLQYYKKSIKSIGDLYLEKGRVDKDETAFSRTAGLYRAALDRCEDSDGRETLQHRIKYVEKVQEVETRKARKRLKRGPSLKKVGSDNCLTSPPMSYEQHIQKGCRALQAGNLDTAEHNFAAALKVVHVKESNTVQHWKEVEPICKLTDVYLKRGMQSKDGGDFTKATALCNAALVRSREEDREDIEQTIHTITQSFVKHVLGLKLTVPCDDIKKHKSQLSECRDYVVEEMKIIQKRVDPYCLDDDDPSIIEVERKRAEAIKAFFDTIVHQRRTFIASLVDECIEVMGPTPCKYAMIGLGSHATGLVTPYSDLEFAILIEKETESIVDYFNHLTHYLHLKVINLGETILPAMAIKSLNDFESDNKLDDWFYDSVTPRGFSFDGAMPHACKTPLGRGKANHLIRTPQNMTKVLEDDVTLHLKKGYHLATVLGSVSFITGEQHLVDDYKAEWDQQLKKNGRKIAKLVADATLKENTQTFQKQDLTARLLDVKKDIYRFSSLAVSCWALLSDIQPTTIWETVHKMHKRRTINDKNAHHLMVLVSISAELRLRTYMNNHGQVENMSALSSIANTSDIGEMSRKVFYVSNTKQLMRYYYTATPLKRFVSRLRERQSIATDESLILFDNSSRLRAEVYTSLCDYQKSKEYTKQALEEEMVKHKTGFVHPDIADILSALGNICIHLGDHEEAVCYFEQVLEMSRSFCGEITAHRVIAASLSNLGNAWGSHGDHIKAINFYEQALKMNRDIYGYHKLHIDIANSLNSLGNAWMNLGDYRKALSYHEQSLHMKLSLYGYNNAHPDIAMTLYNLGIDWRNLGDFKKAISYDEQALQTRRSIYGFSTAHPDIARSLDSLGINCGELGDHRKALSYHYQALQIRKSIYGPSTAHPDITASHNNLGNAWKSLGYYKMAVSSYEQALQTCHSMYGEGKAHPDIARTLNNLGNGWIHLGDPGMVVRYYQQALQMYRSLYGEKTVHLDIASAINNLGIAWSYLGDHRKSLSYHEQALQMKRTIYGENTQHPEIAKSLSNLGLAWSNLGDYRKAVSYYEQSLHIKQNIYGEDTGHPDIACLLNNLGNAWSGLGDYRKAIRYHEQALHIRQSVHGKTTAHPSIVKSLYNLSVAWRNVGDLRKSVFYHDEMTWMEKMIESYRY